MLASQKQFTRAAAAAAIIGLVLVALTVSGCGKDPVSPGGGGGGGGTTGGGGGGTTGGGGSGGGGTTVQYQEVVVSPGSVKELFPRWDGGDRDFGGNGPDVKIQAEVSRLFPTTNRLSLKVWFSAKETRSDWTSASGYWEWPIYTAPSGWVIDAILSQNSGVVTYRDTNGGYDIFYNLSGAAPITSLSAVGDTDGNDVGAYTEGDTHLHWMNFSSVRIRIRKS
jgi:hypothetical protein